MSTDHLHFCSVATGIPCRRAALIAPSLFKAAALGARLRSTVTVSQSDDMILPNEGI